MVGPWVVMESTDLVTPPPIYKLEQTGAMQGRAKVVTKRRPWCDGISLLAPRGSLATGSSLGSDRGWERVCIGEADD